MIPKTLQLKDEVRALEERKAKLLSENEVLEKELTLKRESLGEVLKRLLAADPDYKEIEEGRLKEIDNYVGQRVVLVGEIETSEERKIRISREISNIESSIEKKTEDLKKVTEQLSAFSAEKNRVSDELREVKKEFEEARLEKEAVLARLTKEIKQAREDLRMVEHETKNKKEAIEREERVLGLKQRDLDIYLSRMKKKYPGETFSLAEGPVKRE